MQPLWKVVWMTAKEGRVRVERLSKKGKRTHGPGQQCGDCWAERGNKRIKRSGKKYNKIY